MKKITILLSLLLLISLLAACGSNADAASDADPTGSDSQQESDAAPEGTPPEGFEFEVPLQTALIVGTFELEGTGNEVTAEQAAELLPLWMVLKNLLESETAAAEEITALTNQISETMTESQMEVINNLDLGPQSLRNLMTELGLAEEPDGTEGDGNRGANRPEGMPEGMG
ncbi:MAG: hypothetical protein JW757_07865, partial [Anaerolineales bacterium]|nr:hypothetical protein [Anaerolineales bacterium]